MDTSKEYIKMCNKAVKIQELWEYSKGDFYLKRKNTIDVIGFPNHFLDSGYNSCIWLPRQDQLQEMLDKDILNRRVRKFLYFIRSIEFDGNISRYSYNFESMEQLWLAFVMKEKFNKQWNGEDWEVVQL